MIDRSHPTSMQHQEDIDADLYHTESKHHVKHSGRLERIDQYYQMIGQAGQYLAIHEPQCEAESAAPIRATCVPDMATSQIQRHVVYRPLSGRERGLSRPEDCLPCQSETL